MTLQAIYEDSQVIGNVGKAIEIKVIYERISYTPLFHEDREVKSYNLFGEVFMKLLKITILALIGLMILSVQCLAQNAEEGYPYSRAVVSNPHYYDAYLRGGVVSASLGRFDQALTDYNAAIAISPQDITAYFLRASVFTAMDSKEQAIEDYSRIIAINPKISLAYGQRGMLYFKEGNRFSNHKEDKQKALDDFSQVIELEPNNANAYENRGDINNSLKEYDKALTDYNQAILLTPKNIRLYEKRAFNYMCMGLGEEDWEDQNKIIALDPQNAKAFSSRAALGEKLSKNFDQVIADYTKAIELYSKRQSASDQVNTNHLANLLHSRGDYLRHNGRKDDAIADFTRGLTVMPNYVVMYHSRGVTYFEKGDYDMAIADCTRAIEIYGSSINSWTYLVRGKAYKAKGMYQQALSDFNIAINAKPDLAEAIAERNSILNNISIGLAAKDSAAIDPNDQIIAKYSDIISNNSNDAVAYYERGKIYLNKDQFDLALSDFNRAIMINPNYVTSYLERGWMYGKKGQNDLAFDDYNQAIACDPNCAIAYNNRGSIYAKRGQYDLAIKDFNKAVELNPQYDQPYFNKGVVYAKQHLNQHAVDTYHELIENISPQDTQRIEKVKVLIREIGGDTVVTVSLKIMLTDQGTVEDVILLKSSGYNLFDNAAIDNVKKRIFSPTMNNGKPIASNRFLRMKFQLNDTTAFTEESQADEVHPASKIQE